MRIALDYNNTAAQASIAALTRPQRRLAGAMTATAPFALLEELWALDVPDGLTKLLVLVPVDVPFVGGAAFVRDTTLLHLAAAFALVSFGLYGKYETAPVLSSWTRELMPAKYDAPASFVLGPARVWLVLLWTFNT